MNALSELCENSWYLREKSYKEDQLEQRWLESLPDMRENIISYTVDALEGQICSNEFDWLFTKWTNNDEGYVKLSYVLDDWNEGNVAPEDEPFLNEVVLAAIEGAAELLFNESLYEIASSGGYSINKMIAEVLG